MEKPLFSYNNYKSYLLDRIRSEPKAGRGARLRLANAIGCQIAYISHVLGGDRHFSVDQAEAITRHLALDKDEREFFIWLVEKERAGTKGAQEFFKNLLDQKREQYLQLKKRVDISISHDLSDNAKAVYYSDALYSAIHMAITIRGLQTPTALTNRFDIDLERVGEIINFLKMYGLIQEDRGRLLPTTKYLFLDRSSPFIVQHHVNWRLQSMKSIARKKKNETHLSMTVTMSEKDAQAIRRRIAEFIEETSKVIKESPEEKLMALNIDFFEP